MKRSDDSNFRGFGQGGRGARPVAQAMHANARFDHAATFERQA